MASLQDLVETSESAGGGSGQLSWPVNPEIGEGNVSCIIKGEESGECKFPCPKEVRSTFGLDYAMTDLALYEFINDQFQLGWDEKTGLDMPGDIAGLIEGGTLAALKAIPGESIAAGILRGKGKAVNPHSGMVFNSVKPRVFCYTFDCIARDSGDMPAAQEIFKRLRKACLPKAGPGGSGVFWDYPEKVKMFFTPDPNEMLPKTLDCHITDIDFNFTGIMGSYVTDDSNNPLMAQLTVTLAEIELLDKERVPGDAR